MSAKEEVRRLNERYRILKQEVKDREDEIEQLRQKAISLLGLGQYDWLTVYKVRATEVSSYKRRSYTAVRARLE